LVAAEAADMMVRAVAPEVPEAVPVNQVVMAGKQVETPIIYLQYKDTTAETQDILVLRIPEAEAAALDRWAVMAKVAMQEMVGQEPMFIPAY
jgi:hypothetical protein